MLRDRIVCGIANNQLQRRLLAEPDITFKKALELAQAQESTDQGYQQLQQQQKHSLPLVNKVNGHHRPPSHFSLEKLFQTNLATDAGILIHHLNAKLEMLSAIHATKQDTVT